MTRILSYVTTETEYRLEVALPAPERIPVGMRGCADCAFEVADGEYAAAAIDAHVAENPGHSVTLQSAELIANPHAGELLDDEGRPYNLRPFTWARDDERWDGLELDAIAELQRADARAQIEAEAAPPAPAPDETPAAMPGVGEAL